MSQPVTESAVQAVIAAPKPSLFRERLADFFSSKRAVIGFALLLLLAFGSVFAHWLTPQNPYDLMQLDILDSRLAPAAPTVPVPITTGWEQTDREGTCCLPSCMACVSV